MVIDFHTHTFPEKIAARAIEKLSRASHTVPFTDGTNEGLLESMAESGTDLSVILPVATAPRQVEHINESAAEITSREEGLISFGAMHPDYSGYRQELARIQELGLKGIKIHPVYQGVDLDDLRYLRILDRCAELGLVVVTHAGYDIGFPGVVHCSPQMAARAVSEVNGVRLILAHMGGWRNWDEVPRVLADTDVMIDTSFSTGKFTPLSDGYWKNGEERMLDADQAMAIIRAFGADRVLFGTDSPWSSQSESLDFIRALPLAEEERKQILGGNARKLLALV